MDWETVGVLVAGAKLREGILLVWYLLSESLVGIEVGGVGVPTSSLVVLL
jgi:hypothetical protein